MYFEEPSKKLSYRKREYSSGGTRVPGKDHVNASSIRKARNPIDVLAILGSPIARQAIDSRLRSWNASCDRVSVGNSSSLC